jgi:hypothetical protein
VNRIFLMIFLTARVSVEWILIELRETSNSREFKSKNDREKKLYSRNEYGRKEKNIKEKSFIIEA